MNDNKIKSAYKSINAPKELREKIIALDNNTIKQKNHKYVLQIATLAACFVLVIAVFAFTPLNRNTEILIDGQTITESPITLYGANTAQLVNVRSQQTVTVPISINAKSTTDILASSGTLVITDIKTGNIIMTDTKYTTNKKVSILWQNDMPDSDTVYDMTVKTKNECYTITLKYQKSTDTRTVTCTKTN